MFTKSDFMSVPNMFTVHGLSTAPSPTCNRKQHIGNKESAS